MSAPFTTAMGPPPASPIWNGDFVFALMPLPSSRPSTEVPLARPSGIATSRLPLPLAMLMAPAFSTSALSPANSLTWNDLPLHAALADAFSVAVWPAGPLFVTQ